METVTYTAFWKHRSDCNYELLATEIYEHRFFGVHKNSNRTSLNQVKVELHPTRSRTREISANLFTHHEVTSLMNGVTEFHPANT